MAEFNIAFQLTSAKEAGYSNHPKDTGGETWCGIARNKNPNWSGWLTIDLLKQKANFPDNLKNNTSLAQQVYTFYKRQYWDVLKEDNYDAQAIANKLYDIAVNMGVTTAAKILQRVLNAFNQNGHYYPDLLKDGIIGNTTGGSDTACILF
jgi:lysozyme family protein